MSPSPRTPVASEAALLAAGTHHDPHHILGAHPTGDGIAVRLFHPDAIECSVALAGGVVPMRRIDKVGLFEAVVPGDRLDGYRLRVRTDRAGWEMDDPYRFLPTLGELDLLLIGEGRHREAVAASRRPGH